MASFKVLEVVNSKNTAIRKGRWKNPGAALYDQLMNAVHCKGPVPSDVDGLKKKIKNGAYKDWPALLKEAYLVAPVEGIKGAPYGTTPFSRSGCKYPHHVIRGNKMVLSVPGLRSAIITARNQGVFMNHTKENRQIVAHINRHCKELGLKQVWHHGELFLMEETEAKIEENFHDIYLYIQEKTGINLFDQESAMFESPIEGPAEQPILSADFNDEVGDTTPEALLKWMEDNIEYDKDISNWRLRDAARLYIDRKGNCHDQSYFESLILNSWHYDNWQLFFVEFKDGSNVGGNTHTLTYFKEGSKLYWFEHAWEDQAGIHGPYDSVEDVKQAVLDAYAQDTDINSMQMDGIVFATTNNYRLGMTLGEYVESWNLDDDHRFIGSDVEIKANVTKTTNPNDPESQEAVDVEFFNSEDRRIGEASVSAVDTDHAFLYNLEVDPSYRHQGYGTAILKWCLNNYPITELTVAPDNTVAIHLYEKYGFKKYMDWEENGRKLIDMRRNVGNTIEEAIEIISVLRPDYVTEASHGNLSVDHRLATGVSPDEIKGHKLHVVYSLDGIELVRNDVVYDIARVSDPTSDNPHRFREVCRSTSPGHGRIDAEGVRLLKRFGNTNHQSKNQRVLAIIDTSDGNKKLQEAIVTGPFGLNDSEKVRIRVGEIDTAPSYKSTTWSMQPNGNTIQQIGIREKITSMRGLKGKRAEDLYIDAGRIREFPKQIRTLERSIEYNDKNIIRNKAKLAKQQQEVDRLRAIADMPNSTQKRQMMIREIRRINDDDEYKEDSYDDATLADIDEILQEFDSALMWADETGLTKKFIASDEAETQKARKIISNLRKDISDSRKRMKQWRVTNRNRSIYSYNVESTIIQEMTWIESFVHDDVFREAADVTNMIQLIQKCKTPQELNNWIRCIRYGWIDKAGKVNGTGDDDSTSKFCDEFRLQSPDELVAGKVGVCWDICELERAWFDAKGYEYAVIFVEIEDGDDLPTHTFLIFRDKDDPEKVCYFEGLGEDRGIYKYSSTKTCIEFAVSKFKEGRNYEGTDPINIHIITDPMPAGTTCDDYYDTAHKCSRVDLDDAVIFNESGDAIFMESPKKNAFRLAIDINTGHPIKIVYDMNDGAVVHTSRHNGVLDGKKDIAWLRKYGDTDFSSSGQIIKAIVDVKTGQRLKSVECVGPFDLRLVPQSDIDDPVKLQEIISKSNIKVFTLREGEVDDTKSYKSTFWPRNSKVNQAENPDLRIDKMVAKIASMEHLGDKGYSSAKLNDFHADLNSGRGVFQHPKHPDVTNKYIRRGLNQTSEIGHRIRILEDEKRLLERKIQRHDEHEEEYQKRLTTVFDELDELRDDFNSAVERMNKRKQEFAAQQESAEMITESQMSQLYDYFMEKYTSIEYHVQRFKEKYQYNPATKIAIINGKKIAIDLDYKSPVIKDPDGNVIWNEKMTCCGVYDTPDGRHKPLIALDKHFFMLPPARADVLLQHEMGHLMMQYRKNIPDDVNAQREVARSSVMKFARPGRFQGHINVDEFEADQYARRRTSLKDTKAALRQINKYDRAEGKKELADGPMYLKDNILTQSMYQSYLDKFKDGSLSGEPMSYKAFRRQQGKLLYDKRVAELKKRTIDSEYETRMRSKALVEPGMRDAQVYNPESVEYEPIEEGYTKKEIPPNHMPFTMETLPNIMYFASRNRHPTVQNERVFLTPYIGIASIFIIDVSKAIAEEYKKQTGHLPKHLSMNTSYKEWEECEGPDLIKPLKKVHVTHNIASLQRVTIKGKAKGYIHAIDISNIRDQLKLFSSNDPDREVYYDGGAALKPVEIIPHTLSFEMTYSEANAKVHGQGILERTDVIPDMNDLDWMNTYLCEKSHGLLKVDHRLAVDVNTGHQLHIIYSLDGMILTKNMVNGRLDQVIGGNQGDIGQSEISRLKQEGNTNHESYNQKVLAIIDMQTGEHLSSATTKGPYGYGGTFDVKVGEVDMHPTFKSTFWGNTNTTGQIAKREEIGRMRGVRGHMNDMLGPDRMRRLDGIKDQMISAPERMGAQRQQSLDLLSGVLPPEQFETIAKTIPDGTPEEIQRLKNRVNEIYHDAGHKNIMGKFKHQYESAIFTEDTDGTIGDDISKMGIEDPPDIEDPATKESPEPSEPEQIDKAETNKNGVNRKKLYQAFIGWAKKINKRNAFGCIFDKDAFKVTYPFIPEGMRYFYRLANPLLCVLENDLTFFSVAQLRKINDEEVDLSEHLVFAGTEMDMRVFNKKDKKIYIGTEEGGKLVLGEVLADSFDMFIQDLIGQGDILNGESPMNEPVEDTMTEELPDAPL